MIRSPPPGGDPTRPDPAHALSTTTRTDHHSDSPLQAISNAMAQVYKSQFGRGPTKVRTMYAGPDAIVCILEDTQTPAERKLVAMGEDQRLRDVRLFFQYAAEQDLKRPIEEATGRRVRAFISGIDTRADASAETFLLESVSE
jgi:uncharacterized protein YbcI